MTLLEKTVWSAEKNLFTIFKEGLFYKCYNEDAMVFTERVKNYKSSSKFVKSVGALVYSVGFPASIIEKGNLSFESIKIFVNATSYKEEQAYVVFYVSEDLKSNYSTYQQTLTVSKANFVAVEPFKLLSNNSDLLVKMIIDFDLANSTPMDGLIFIKGLKEQIKAFNCASNVVASILGVDDGFKFEYYWSSTEGNAGGAWRLGFFDNYADFVPKTFQYRVRAARNF
jgi:hypothetical protein